MLVCVLKLNMETVKNITNHCDYRSRQSDSQELVEVAG
jgi:hypothetical protein